MRKAVRRVGKHFTQMRPNFFFNSLILQNIRVVSGKILTLFWAVTVCSLVDSYRRFGGSSCFHLKCRTAKLGKK